jgi:hypothetical protein
MAKVVDSHIRKAGEVMSLPEQQHGMPLPTNNEPVRVKLERINCDVAKSLPPDGSHQIWLDRVKAALGTPSTARQGN